MQIPENLLHVLSVKGKAYLEAAMKISEGHRLLTEGTAEMNHLDGKKTSSKKFKHAGGVDVMPRVQGLARPKMTPEYLKRFLKKEPLKTGELADAAGCSREHVRCAMADATGVHRVGTGNQVKWSLVPATGRIAKKKRTTVANRTVRKFKPKTKGTRTARTRQQATCAALDPEQQKADEDKIVALLEQTPNLTKGVLMKKLKRSYYPFERALQNLLATKRLKEAEVVVEKTGRTLTTWVPAHGA